MLLGRNEGVSDLIIRTLATQSQATANELHHQIELEHRAVTLQGLYKELRKLQEEGIIVKIKKSYSLQLSWILALLKLSSEMYSSQLDPDSSAFLLPREDESCSWSFPNLLRLNEFWSHITLALFQDSVEKTLYEWIPHPWFYLIQAEQQVRYERAMEPLRDKNYMIIGSDTYLDRWCEQFLQSPVDEYSFAESPFSTQRNTYLNVVDDLVLTIKLTSKFTRTIDDMYASIRGPRDVDIPKIVNTLTAPTRIQVKLENNRTKARRLKRKFCDFFGVQLPKAPRLLSDSMS